MKRKNTLKTSTKGTGLSHSPNFEFIFGKLFESFNEENWTNSESDDFEALISDSVNYAISDIFSYYTKLQKVIKKYKSFTNINIYDNAKDGDLAILVQNFYDDIFNKDKSLTVDQAWPKFHSTKHFFKVEITPDGGMFRDIKTGCTWPDGTDCLFRIALTAETKNSDAAADKIMNAVWFLKYLNVYGAGLSFFSDKFKNSKEYDALKGSGYSEIDPDLWVKQRLSTGGIINYDNFYRKSSMTVRDFEKPLDWWFEPAQIDKWRQLLTLYAIWKYLKKS